MRKSENPIAVAATRTIASRIVKLRVAIVLMTRTLLIEDLIFFFSIIDLARRLGLNM